MSVLGQRIIEELCMQKNSGIKGNPAARSMNRNLDRELKRKEPQSAVGTMDVCASTVSGSPFSKTCERRRDEEKRGGPQMGMGKAKIQSDHRTDCLISEKNKIINHHADRADEYGGITPDTDMTIKRQGNTLAQPSDNKGKFNRDNNVVNSNDSDNSI